MVLGTPRRKRKGFVLLAGRGQSNLKTVRRFQEPSHTSQQGFVGGYIVKNSWWDGLPPGPGWKQARGSHSVAFFMQQVSPADEAAVCPNAHSPQSWYPCGSVRACRSNKTAAFARAANQPLHRTCLDASPFLRGRGRKCEPLFLRSIAPFGGGLATAVLEEAMERAAFGHCLREARDGSLLLDMHSFSPGAVEVVPWCNGSGALIEALLGCVLAAASSFAPP